tara:strand:- start:730 stop:1464 length:735 start_codon:yes stop_codon:yes gene_type:complete
MEYGIVNLNLIPVRKKNNAKSEMISQLFFGETLEVVSKKNNWCLMISTLDNYKGWVRDSHFLSIPKLDYIKINRKKKKFSSTDTLLYNNNFKDYTVPAGSMISNCKYLGFNRISNDKYFHSLEEIALSFLNSPYLWGGKTKFGTDCSGFVQSAFKIYGKILPRDSYQQALIGTEVNLENSKTGDLAFFGKKIDTITHVGIVISNNRIIHSAGKVRIDNIINEGIFNVDSRKISHKLQLVRRIVN